MDSLRQGVPPKIRIESADEVIVVEYKRLKSKPGLVLLIAVASCGILAAQEYEGPTVLSRSGGGLRPYGQRVGEESKMRVFVSAEVLYDYGFLPIATSTGGVPAKFGGQFGYQGRIGVYGTKRWRRTSLGLDYTGSYRGYVKNTYFNGADNFLGMEFGDQLDRKTLLTGSLTAGTSNRVFGFSSGLIGSPLGNLLPTTDIFDARTYFLNGGMGVSHQLTSRIGFELRAEGFRVERHSASLISVQGYSPKASMSYRLNRRQTVGGLYNFYHYEYPKAFGESNVHVAMAFWNYDVSRQWRFEAQGGAFVANNAGTRTVAADPIVQQLLGVKSISEAFSRIVTLPNAQVKLTGKSGNSTVTFGVYRGVGAGNGVTLASSEQSGSIIYYYVFNKALTTSARGTYTRAAGLSGVADRYTTYSGGLSVDYNTANAITYSFNSTFRHSDGTLFRSFNSDSFQLGLSVGWSLRDVPFIH